MDKTHCKKGHEYTPDNLRWRPGTAGRLVRDCRLCRIATTKNWREKNPDRWKAAQKKHLTKNAARVKHLMRVRCLRRAYGLTIADYDRMLKEQHGVCALCGKFKLRKRTEFLSVDHNHVTGKVRGLLCYMCNSSIGHFKDDPAKLRAAANYVETRGV